MGSDEISDTTFGLFIAYLLPGLTAIYGIPVGIAAQRWQAISTDSTLGLPQIILILITALAVGLTVSTVRWLVIDTVHHRTGIRCSRWDFANLQRNVAAFEFLIQIHYRYYKFYSNMVVALAWAYIAGGYAQGWASLVYWLLGALFFMGSRDSLRKYYERAGRLLASGS
jgi:hypothetical protein